MQDKILALDIDEAAKRLSLSPRTVATLIAKGELGSLKVGRRRIIPLGALEEFLRRDHTTQSDTTKEPEAAKAASGGALKE